MFLQPLQLLTLQTSLEKSWIRFARETWTLRVALKMIKVKFLRLIPAITVFMWTGTGKFVIAINIKESMIWHHLFSVYHKIQPKEGSIGFTFAYNFKISLNGSNEYVVYINDPHFGFPTLNPAAVSRTSLLLSKNSQTFIYLKVNELSYCIGQKAIVLQPLRLDHIASKNIFRSSNKPN